MGFRQLWRDLHRGQIPGPEHLIVLVQPHLAPGEEVRHLFSGIRQMSSLIRWVVAVTDRRIIVVEAKPGPFIWQPLRPTDEFQLPRETRLGPRSGRMWYVVAGYRLAVPLQEDQRTIAAADAEMGFPPPV